MVFRADSARLAVADPRSAKPLFAGSIPARASNITLMDSVTYGQPSTDECASVIVARPLVIMVTWYTVATECTPPVYLREVCRNVSVYKDHDFGTGGNGSPASRFLTSPARNSAKGLIFSPTLAFSSAAM